MLRSLMVRRSPLIALLVAASACRTAAPETPAPATACAGAIASDSLPSPCEILERHVAGVGGHAALRAIQSVEYVATLEYPAGGIRADVVAYTARPNRMTVRATITGIGEMSNGYDGEVGWSILPTTGPRVLEGRELAMARDNADFDALTKRASRYSSLQTVGRTEFEGRPAWHLHLVLQSGRETDEYYDVESGLQIGSVSLMETAGMTARITTILEDYRQFGPLLLPAREIQRMPTGKRTVLTRTTVRFNEVPDSVFALPPQIRTLVGR